jgi:hypothetical protein
MVTLTQAVQYAIAKQARAIHDLKMAARVVESYHKYGYISPDGKSFSSKRPSEPEKADWKPGKFSGEKIAAHMSPKSGRWQQYRAARSQASLLLTARLILKSGGEAIPSIGELRVGLKEGKLSQHARRGCHRRLAFKAYRYLRKLGNRLERRPEVFAEVRASLDAILDRTQTDRERIGGHGH